MYVCVNVYIFCALLNAERFTVEVMDHGECVNAAYMYVRVKLNAEITFMRLEHVHMYVCA